MTRRETEVLAESLLQYHGLEGWRLAWLNTKRVAGNCDRRGKRIGVSRHWVEVNEFKGVREILLHEIAHALTANGHTGLWKLVALAIGCHSNRRLPEWVKPPQGGWWRGCRRCAWGDWAYRQPTGDRSCLNCGNAVTVERVGQ